LLKWAIVEVLDDANRPEREHKRSGTRGWPQCAVGAAGQA